MSNAKKFSANGTDIDVQKFLNKIDLSAEPYITNMNWGAKRANAFRQSLLNYKLAISSGSISAKNDKGQYVDTSGSLLNLDEKFKGALGIDFLRKDRDINGDVASFLDAQLTPMVLEKLNTPKLSFNPNFMNYFNNQAFGSDTLDWDSWQARDKYNMKGKAKVLENTNRIKAFSDILSNYKNKVLQDDQDYDWGDYGNRDLFISRIDNAIKGLTNGFDKNDYATLGSLGITKDLIDTNLFNSSIKAKVEPKVAPKVEDPAKVAEQPKVEDPAKVAEQPKVDSPALATETPLEKIQREDALDALNLVTNSILAFRRDLQKHGWGNVAVPVTSTAQSFSGKVPTALALAEQMKSGSTNIDLNRTSIANAAALYFSKYANLEPNAYLGTNALGQKEYIVPYTPNKNGTFVVYNQSTGGIRQVPISNYLKYNDTKNPKFVWLAKYIYRHENGGIIKNKDGGVLPALKAKLNTLDSLELIRTTHPLDLPAGFVYDPTARLTTEQQYNLELAKANTAKPVLNSKYDVISPKMSGLLSLRNIANAADLVSIPASFIPGVGTATSGILGGVGTIANFAADLNEGVPLAKAFRNLEMNAGMTFVSMIPGLAATKYAKYANALKNVKGVEAIAEALKSAKLYKNIRNGTMVAAGAPLAYNTVNNIAKVYDDPSKRNWGNLLLNLGNDALYARGIKYRNAKIGKDVPVNEAPKGGTTNEAPNGGTTNEAPNGTGTVAEGTNKPEHKGYTVLEYDANGNPVNRQPAEPANNPKPEPTLPTNNPEPAQTKKPSVLSNVLGFAKKHKVATTIGATTAALAALNSAKALTPTRPRLTDISFYGNPTSEGFGNLVKNTDVGRFNFNPKTGEVNLYDPAGNRIWNNNRVLHTLMLPEVSITGTKKAKPVNKHKDGGVLKYLKGSSFTSGNGGNPKKTLINFDKVSSAYNRMFPDISAGIRMIGDINTNNKVKNQMLEGMHAPLFNPYNVHHGIYGNEGQKQSYYNKAAELEYQPQSITSDASLQLASNLDRKLNADKYRFLGDLENNKAIAENAELANKYNMLNALINNEIASRNMQAMNATNLARTQLLAQTTAANQQSIDTFLEQQDYRSQAKNEKISELQGNNIQDWLQYKYANTPEALQFQKDLSNWMSNKNNTDITKWDKYTAYQNYNNTQLANYKNEMNKYLRQMYPGYNPMLFNNENKY